MKSPLESYILPGSTLENIEQGGRFSLMDENYIWYVQAGAVDVFIKKNILYPIGRVNEGEFCIGIDKAFLEKKSTLIGRVCSHTSVMKIKKEFFNQLPAELYDSFAKKMDIFIHMVTKDNIKNALPRQYIDVFSLKEAEFEQNTNITTSESVRWIDNIKSDAFFIGDSGFTIKKETLLHLPLTSYSWFEMCEKSSSPVYETVNLIGDALFWKSLEIYFSIIIKLCFIHIENEKLFYNIVLYNKVEANEAAIKDSLAFFKRGFYEPKEQLAYFDSKADPVYAAIARVGNYLKINIPPVKEPKREFTARQVFKTIMKRGKTFYRNVHLEEEWYQHNHGPLIAFLKENDKPLALIPNKHKKYLAYDSATAEGELVTPEMAEKIDKAAFMIYRKEDKSKITLIDLLTPTVSKSVPMISDIIFAMLAASILGLGIPLLTQYIFENSIISDDKTGLVQIGLILLAITLSVFGFELTKQYLILNLENKLDFSIQGTYWDKILRLPVNFFKTHAPGEFVSWVGNLVTMRTLLANNFFILVFSLVMMVVNFSMLFYYSAEVSLKIFLAFVVLIGIYITILFRRLTYEFLISTEFAKMYALLSEFFSAISKIRLAGAEYRVFLRWTIVFSKLRRLYLFAQRYTVYLSILIEGVPLLLIFVMYLSIAFYSSKFSFSTGKFLAFNIILGQLAVVVYQLMGALFRLLPIIPMYKKSRIFLDAKSEVTSGILDPGELKGAIEINNVSFKYAHSAGYILNNVSFNIEAGEYVAIVGKTGVGKSTLMRLLVGFDTPLTGRIYYDGKDLSTIDVNLVRQQLGIVLQQDSLTPGSIYDNIAGVSDVNIDDVWKIAEEVGLAEDILNMPMQMNTIINLDGQGLSGGQKQRILIARAILRKPKILILDEATRALDNVTQKMVIDCLLKLKMTRIVIAHRLSTLVKVDRILVIENGMITEMGTYKELIAKKGTFYQLIQKQVV